jgi:hypothetical protein
LLQISSAEIQVVEMVNGMKLALRKGDSVGDRIAENKNFDPVMGLLLKRLVKPGQVAVDVGAHYGYLTIDLINAVGKEGKVFAIEPSPELLTLVEKSVGLNGLQDRNVEYHNLAIGKEHKMIEFEAKLTDTFATEVLDQKSHTSISVQMTTID